MMLRKILLSLTVAMVLLSPLQIPALAANTANLAIYYASDGDMFWNYDFDNTNVASNNVDWPPNMIFINNASVPLVKQNIYWANYGSEKQERLSDGGSWYWDGDTGTKSNPTDYDAYHLRLYAANGLYMYNPTWEAYVVGTSHFDQFPYYGWSGGTEAYLCNRAEQILGAQNIARNSVYLYNYEEYRAEGTYHIWDNDGWASVVNVP